MVASDVAARGLDIKGISHIINYDLPKTAKEYIHRIGRTARAGEEGRVISLLSEQDHDNFRSVLEDRSLVIEQLNLPEFKRIAFFASGRSPDSGQRERSFRSRGGPRREGQGSRYGARPRRNYHSGGERGYGNSGEKGNRSNRGDRGERGDSYSSRRGANRI